MIKFSDFQVVNDLNNLNPPLPYQFAFSGHAVDKRGEASTSFTKEHSVNAMQLSYDFRKFELSIDDTTCKVNQIDKFMPNIKTSKVLLDATTLNSVELALIIRGYMDAQRDVEFDFLYVEPDEYSPKHDDLDASNSHAFSLSASLLEESFTVPGFKHLLKQGNEAHVLIIVGFEKERLGAMLNTMESHHVSDCTLIFGVPAFKPSMEIHSLMQNASLIDNNVIKTIDFVAANNPISTYKMIHHIKESLSDNEVLELAPMGPNPSTLACALYAAHDKSVSLRYDFPKPANNRTLGIGKASLYSVIKSCS